MILVDVDELATLDRHRLLLGTHWWNPATLRRRDYYGDPGQPLSATIRGEVERQLGFAPKGPLRLLTNLRTWAWSANPLSVYWCYDENDQLVAQVLEVTNTPWHEKHLYVVDAREGDGTITRFAKELHVSPFFDMTFTYEWETTTPAETLRLHLLLMRENEVFFRAGLTGTRRPLSTWALLRVLLLFPSQRVSLGIYLRAVGLFRRGAKFVAHPRSSAVQEKI